LLLKFPMLCVETSSLWSQAALLRYTEPRYESIGNTFLVHPDFRHTVPSAARRSRSFSHVSLELKAIQESLSSSESSDSTDVIGSSDESATEDVGCTMMLRNIPHGIEQQQLLAKLRACGFEKDLEFVYLPMIFGNRRPTGRGFAFVGLKSQQAATELTCSWHQTSIFGETRLLTVARAHVQGYEANLKKWGRTKTSRIQNDRYKPWTAGAGCR